MIPRLDTQTEARLKPQDSTTKPNRKLKQRWRNGKKKGKKKRVREGRQDRWKVGRGSKKGERKGEEVGRKGGKDRNLNLTARQ